MLLRRLESHESTTHRDLRLRALQDAPDCFGETFAEASVRPLSYWEELTQSVTGAAPNIMFLASEDSLFVGSTYGLTDRHRQGWGRVGGMWVDSVSRRAGIGSALLERVLDWARLRDMHGLGLWAPAHSMAAVSLYRKFGFRETGAHRPLPTDPSLSIIEMELSNKE